MDGNSDCHAFGMSMEEAVIITKGLSLIYVFRIAPLCTII